MLFFSAARASLREGRGVDADRKRTDLHPPAVNLAPIAARGSPRIGGDDAIAEIIGVGLGLKTNDIIGAEAAQNPLVGGHGARHVRPRPRDMQKKANPVGAAHLTQKTRHGNEMIIMHPDDVIGTQQLMELAGEVFVHPEISGSVSVRQIGEVEAIMANRPKRPIGETAIILFDVAA